jgi:hypothetical protein
MPVNHDDLDGLQNDTHLHYHNDARGDARYSQLGHNHDDRYYTETEVDTALAGKSDVSHTHAYAKYVSGSYVGDGTTSHSITGLGGKPVYLSIRILGSVSSRYEWLDQLPDTNTCFRDSVYNTTGEMLVSIDNDGFTVTAYISDNHPNSTGVTYMYWALLQ